MDRSERYLEHPVLYTTGDFPQLALRLILEGLRDDAFDEALVNGLRIYFLVNPQRFVGPHNPTNIYTVFLLLDILDALLGLSAPPGITNDKVDKWFCNLSARGLSKDGLICWRHRICADLKKRLDSSAAHDLLVLAKKREEQALQITVQEQNVRAEGIKITAEREMKSASWSSMKKLLVAARVQRDKVLISRCRLQHIESARQTHSVPAKDQNGQSLPQRTTYWRLKISAQIGSLSEI
ncbi:hypothetical protein IMSHALPRED_004771 [Imshaugia aleurites]|uniref:Uncharacterized protein n=1 Tax=Imshaugia aleurites TaxID=172621 RepID=A0A8H3FC48_9LECA|nr:hypothetical protein IMSHALPRED_004771 [Imshaugia aleurites]